MIFEVRNECHSEDLMTCVLRPPEASSCPDLLSRLPSAKRVRGKPCTLTPRAVGPDEHFMLRFEIFADGFRDVNPRLPSDMGNDPVDSVTLDALIVTSESIHDPDVVFFPANSV